MGSGFYRYPCKIFHPKELHVKSCSHRTYAKTFSPAFRILTAVEIHHGAQRDQRWQATVNDPVPPIDSLVKELSRAAHWVRSAKRHSTALLAPPEYRVGPTDGKYTRHRCV